MANVTTPMISRLDQTAHLRRFRASEFHRMIEEAILGPEERVELRDGLILSLQTVPIGPRLFHKDEYHRLAEAGILAEDERVELIEGMIYTVSPPGNRHAGCVDF